MSNIEGRTANWSMPLQSTELLQGTLDLLILKTRLAKFYSLSRLGRKQLESELENWKRISGAIALVLEEG